MPGFDTVPFTWGDSSFADKAAHMLDLETHLPNVPQGGTFVDVGSGPGCGLGAVAHLARPDLRIISVDPGFGLAGTTAETLAKARQLMLDYSGFDEDELARLLNTDAWYADRRSDYAEELASLESESVDLMGSFAAIPEHARDPTEALQACLRTLKAGGLAIHGPMYRETFGQWDGLVRQAVAEGTATAYEPGHTEMEVRFQGIPEDAEVYLTSFQKAAGPAA
jgi:SAM-dependent methyltransferase